MHTDIPTRKDVERLMSVRKPGCVSIYLPTSPVPAEAAAARIELKNLAGAAIAQLAEAGMERRAVRDIEEALDAVVDDEGFWSRQGRSLALFATDAGARTFRLPNRLTGMVEVSDRFHVKPLLRTLTFPQAAIVLALSQNGVRLVEVTPDDAPVEIEVPEMPRDAASSVGKASLGDRSADRRIQGAEGKKVRLRQYAHHIERALRPRLSGMDLPLILAATEPLESIFRAANTYPDLADPVIPGSPDELSNAELAAASRAVLDELYAKQLADLRAVYAERVPQGRASDDLGEIARAATFGAVDTVFLDIDTTIPGFVDDETGALTLDDADDAANYGVADEIARRVLLTGGRVLAVRSDDVPGSGSVAAILRHAV
jgi:hypothetical protein